MFVRRRPLLRAAVVGGGAYVAGKRMAQRSAAEAEQESTQDERISSLESQQRGGAAQPRTGQPEPPSSVADQLRQLASLHDQGVLSDDEFARAKEKLLRA